MQKYVSILRGINVSGSKIIKMDALKKMYESLKFKNTKTYIQSGNVVFESSEQNTQKLATLIASAIKKEFTYDVPVIVLNANELNEILAANPFVTRANVDPKFMHVTVLAEEPLKELLDKIIPGNFGEDEFAIIHKAVYLYCSAGYGNTKLNNTFFENKLKVNATTRNWKTMNELKRLLEEMG